MSRRSTVWFTNVSPVGAGVVDVIEKRDFAFVMPESDFGLVPCTSLQDVFVIAPVPGAVGHRACRGLNGAPPRADYRRCH